jgi:hypothetical protein
MSKCSAAVGIPRIAHSRSVVTISPIGSASSQVEVINNKSEVQCSLTHVLPAGSVLLKLDYLPAQALERLGDIVLRRELRVKLPQYATLPPWNQKLAGSTIT